ncbi:ATP-binding protein [Vibrio alginolyticus]
MTLKFTSQKEHKGFYLNEPLNVSSQIMLLTGRNGAGKSRFLEAIQDRQITVTEDGLDLPHTQIRLLKQSSEEGGYTNPYTPRFQGAYKPSQVQERKESTIKAYKQSWADLDLSKGELQKTNRHPGKGGGNNILSFDSFHTMCAGIAKTLGKKPSELTVDELKYYWEEPAANVIGFQNLSYIFNEYINRVLQNEFNEFLSERKDRDVPYYSSEEFVDEFGQEPWIILNEIVFSITEGKFCFSTPNDNEPYTAQIIDSKTHSAIPLNGLSSGETTLLWLAITLFNSEYYNPDQVNAPKLLLLDEPDAYLHPKMVEKMFMVLETFCNHYNTQVILTTHSPTTVALSPNESTFIVNNNAIEHTDKDTAISELLDGISQISISSENRRQVFVESHFDVNFYQSIYPHVCKLSDILDPKISLTFVSSGAKMPEEQVKECLKKIFNIDNPEDIAAFTKAVNGVGCCSQVYGSVQALMEEGNQTVRGIVDWDKKNKPKNGVSVLAQGAAYTLENLALDPICVSILLHHEDSIRYSAKTLVGDDIHWLEWLGCQEHLQTITDWFINEILDKPNARDCEVEYMSGSSVLSDKEYVHNKTGHIYEQIIVRKFPKLRRLLNMGSGKQANVKNGELNTVIATKSMINLTGGKLIPKEFETLFLSVQKS